MPFIIKKVLLSSQVSSQILTPLRQLQTHPLDNSLSTINTLQFHTLQAPQQLVRAVNMLQDKVTIPRDVCRILFKAGKAIRHRNATIAGLEAENVRLKATVEALQPQKKRKAIAPDPNKQFNNIKQIVAALEAAETETRAKPAKKQRVEQSRIGRLLGVFGY